MYYVIVPEEMEERHTREEAIEEAQHMMDSGDYNEVYIVCVTDKFTNSVHHEVVE